ncbi:cyclohexanone monooxygenase [[Emmonsia] crescens]|uniref:Cyclohexanone monooxygenase n=1 Tax=[Emmonsia] crescens TaxID=73230 RepID=A0A2B7ZTC0_9EURO|nr:cyclohexanone monooxygenase [Emmonsia crescens]
MPGMTSNKVPFDPAALKAKYLEERNKRIRDDGIKQYQAMDISSLKNSIEDPYVKPRFSRTPIDEDVEFLVIGAGFGGQLIAARLIEAGITNIRIVDKAGDFGGTWYWNRYPGAACDLESYIYMPLLEELNYIPTEKYTRAPELLEHARNIGRHYGLYDKALFQTEVVSLGWDAAASRWTAKTNHGDTIHAQFVATASGPLHKPKLPGVPGIEKFKGHSFHTSRWDYDYTGGDTLGGLDKLADKRVGIIGTGATAVQIIPHVGCGAKHLYVFQRTPSSVDKRLDQPTDPAWAASLTKGWQQKRMDNFNIIVSGGHQDEDLVQDGWTDILRNLSVHGGKDQPTAQPGAASAMQMADFRKMEQVRARVDQVVKDPMIAEKLKAYYNQFCKRPCFHDEYLPTFNRDNVTLVDTDGKGIERITETGIVVNGEEIQLDCIIYATGFEFSTDYSKRIGIEIKGLNGTTLTEKWEDGEKTSTYHGLWSRGFPNLFIVSILQSGMTPNFTHMLDAQSKHIAYVVKECKERKVRSIQPKEEAERKWVETIMEGGKLQRDFVKECTPGYYNQEGQITERALRNSSYGYGSVAFIKLLEGWRGEGKLGGLELKTE